MLTNPKNYDILLISDIFNIISEYSDVKSLSNLQATSKKYNNQNENLKIAKKLHTKYSIDIDIINLLKSEKAFLQIKLDNANSIRCSLFKTLLHIIIKKNKYKANYLICILDLQFTLKINRDTNFFKEISLYTTNFINDNLQLIKYQNKFELWNYFFNLRANNQPFSTFDEKIQKFIVNDL